VGAPAHGRVDSVPVHLVTRFEAKSKADGSFNGRFTTKGQGGLSSFHGHGTFSGNGDQGVCTLK